MPSPHLPADNPAASDPGIEFRLRASLERNASILQAALDCIVIMDAGGRVLEFNPAAEATFGFERRAVIGRPLTELIIPPRYREAHRRALSAYVATGTPHILGQRLELEANRADGSTIPVELTVNRLGTEEPPVFVGFVRDLTSRRESELEQSRLLREALVARAQAEAAGIRAEHAREEAEQARAEAELARGSMAILFRAGRLMAESMDWQTTLKTVVRSVVPTIAEWCWLTVVEPRGRFRVVALAHEAPDREALAWDLLHADASGVDGLFGAADVIGSGQMRVLEDVSVDAAGASGPGLADLGIRQLAVAPLTVPGGVLGTLSFGLGAAGRRFGGDDLDVMRSLAVRAAMHLQNARLYTERSHIARTLQASLRPRPLPAIEGADVAARYRPAGDQNEAGGDFYDVFPSGDRVWTAIVGDVVGKGAEAAAITAVVRQTLRTASRLDDDPASNLALLNTELCTDGDRVQFCTVFHARVCPGADGLDLRFANGGHPPPMLVHPDGRVEAVESGRGSLVGGFDDARFDEAELTLEPGALLLIYTDGVTEVKTDDTALGERELRRTLAAHAGETADAVVAAVERRVLELQGGSPRDDLALVAIRALPDRDRGPGRVTG